MILSLMGLCKLKRRRGSIHFLSKYASFATWSHKECRWREREKRAAGTMNVSWGPYLNYQVRVTIPLCRQGNGLRDERRERCGRLPESHTPVSLGAWAWAWSRCAGSFQLSCTCQLWGLPGDVPPSALLAPLCSFINVTTAPSPLHLLCRFKWPVRMKCSEHCLLPGKCPGAQRGLRPPPLWPRSLAGRKRGLMAQPHRVFHVRGDETENPETLLVSWDL